VARDHAGCRDNNERGIYSGHESRSDKFGQSIARGLTFKVVLHLAGRPNFDWVRNLQRKNLLI
jgi:hypothetical protein